MKSSEKKYFPMFVDLTDKKVVVAGAGTIAKRRIRAMLEFTEHLTVIAPEVNPELRTLEEQGKLTVLRKAYEREDLYDAALVIAATNDKKTNEDIYAACKCLGIPVNVCNDRDKCDFYFPGIATCGNTVIGVSTNGREKRRQQALAKQMEKQGACCSAEADLEKACKTALQRADQEGFDVVLFAGSLYLIGAARGILRHILEEKRK